MEKRIRIVVRFVSVVSLALCFRASAAAAPAPLPPGTGKYAMVLWESGIQIPGKGPTEVFRNVEEPDVVKLGGRVLHQRRNHRLIVLPVAAADELRRHASVIYLQRLWQGESLTEWDDRPSSAGRPGVESDTSEELQWAKSYAYDGSGNIKQTGTDEYRYDSAGRLIFATLNGHVQSYRYDAFGNLVEVTGKNPTTIPVDGSSNRIAGSTYDVNGNLIAHDTTREYVYDSAGMLANIVDSGYAVPDRTYVYDADDEQIGTIMNPGETNWTVRDFGGRPLREYRGWGRSSEEEWWVWNNDRVYAEGKLVAGEDVVWPQNHTPQYGGQRHYHLDHLGSVRVVTDSAGRTRSVNDYYAFGVAQTNSYQEQIVDNGIVDTSRFAGHSRDFLGLLNAENTDYLDNMHARFYDPRKGRFLSVDPINSAKRKAPQTWNKYAYANNSPINNLDPDGRSTEAAFLVATPKPIPAPPPVLVGVVGFGVGWGIGRAIGHIPVGGGETVDSKVQAGFELLIALSSRAKQLGDRAKEGSVGDAIDQLESIQDKQRRIREGKGSGIIESTGKSEQRVRDALDKIKSLDDALEDDDAETEEEGPRRDDVPPEGRQQ